MGITKTAVKSNGLNNDNLTYTTTTCLSYANHCSKIVRDSEKRNKTFNIKFITRHFKDISNIEEEFLEKKRTGWFRRSESIPIK